ncbi:MAG: 3-phosphoshikimate 1-carboxyvinyltransferase [Phycisphaerales bacterium]
METLQRPLDELPDPLHIPPLTARGRIMFLARIRPPGSKSLTNRALLLGALAGGESTLRGALVDADDTERMAAGLRQLGAGVALDGTGARIRGVGGAWRTGEGIRIDAGESGTTARFLSAAALFSRAPVTIDGSPRLRERPMGELTDALGALGAGVASDGRGEFLPLTIRGPAALPRAPVVDFGTTASSQFISAVLLIAPWLPGGLTVRLEGEVTSRSYITMTIGLLEELGITVRTSEDLRVIRVCAGAGGAGGAGPGPAAGVAPFTYHVEPDASSATPFWGAAALFPGAVARIEDLDARSLQGDAAFPDVLARLGATIIREEGARPFLGIRGPASLDPLMADLSDMPDAAMTLAVVASFAGGRSIIRGLRTLRLKESDRVAALRTELRKVGVRVETGVSGDPDAITVTPPRGGIDASPEASRVEFDTYNDHRMAMALALVALRRPNTWIRDPGCVRKTYPGFWKQLAELY